LLRALRTRAHAPALERPVAALARAAARRVIEAGLDAGDVRPERWWLDADGTGGVVLDGVEVI
jgi:hypothetical protein